MLKKHGPERSNGGSASASSLWTRVWLHINASLVQCLNRVKGTDTYRTRAKEVFKRLRVVCDSSSSQSDPVAIRRRVAATYLQSRGMGYSMIGAFLDKLEKEKLVADDLLFCHALLQYEDDNQRLYSVGGLYGQATGQVRTDNRLITDVNDRLSKQRRQIMSAYAEVMQPKRG